MTQYLNGFVYAINDSGEAAGGSISDGQAMATVFKNGIATVIVSLPSHAVGINSAASVVGSYQPAGYDRRRLFDGARIRGLTRHPTAIVRGGGRHQRPR